MDENIDAAEGQHEDSDGEGEVGRGVELLHPEVDDGAEQEGWEKTQQSISDCGVFLGLEL